MKYAAQLVVLAAALAPVAPCAAQVTTTSASVRIVVNGQPVGAFRTVAGLNGPADSAARTGASLMGGGPKSQRIVVTLKGGAAGDAGFVNWVRQGARPGGRQTMKVQLMGPAGQVQAAWSLTGCMPVSYGLASMAAGGAPVVRSAKFACVGAQRVR